MKNNKLNEQIITNVETESKNIEKRNKIKTVLNVALFTLGVLFLNACSPAKADELIEQSIISPKPPATATFTPEPSPTVKPTASPTASPTADVLSEEEIKNEIELLGMKNPDETINLSTVNLVYFTYLDENNNEVENISLLYAYGDVKNNKKSWNFCDNFTSEILFTCYSTPNTKDYDVLLDAEIKTEIKKFKGIDLKAFIPFVSENFEYFEQDFGIKLNKTPWLWNIDYKEVNNIDYSAPAIEWARAYIEIVPKKYRTNAATFMDDPTITPTSSYNDNPSIEYLMGNRDIEEEFGHRTRKM